MASVHIFSQVESDDVDRRGGRLGGAARVSLVTLLAFDAAAALEVLGHEPLGCSLRFAALGYLRPCSAFPVGLVFWRTFENGVGPVWDAATIPEALHALWLTVLIALIAVPANTIFGVICALVIVRDRFRGQVAR